MYRFTSVALVLFVAVVLPMTSCKKKCEISKDENLGAIVPEAIVYEHSAAGRMVVRGNSPGAKDYRVSFDGGFTYNPIDFNEYVLMSLPYAKSCHSQVVKTVTVKNTLSRVEYLVTVNECPDCEDKYTIANWVLVRKFPESYKVFYTTETRTISEAK